MQVREVMHNPVASCLPTETVLDAATRMAQEDCGSLPVVDDDGRPIGMVTDRDLLMAAVRERRSLEEIPVDYAMSSEVFSCHENDRVQQAESLMCRHQVRRVPVTDESGALVGILSLGDLARAQDAKATGDPDPDRQVVAAILEAVVQPTPESRVT